MVTTDRVNPQAGVRSRAGVAGALVLLLSIPMTVLLTNLFWADGAETLIHLGLATGFALIAIAVPDFRTGRWSTRVGVAAMAGLSAIFVAQGVSESVESSTLHRIAFDVLGQGLETLLMDVFVAWCVLMLLTSSHGKTLAFGYVALVGFVLIELARLATLLLDAGALPEVLKLTSLLVVVWFLLESRRPVAKGPSSLKSSREMKLQTSRVAS
jgi:hypothetical protein